MITLDRPSFHMVATDGHRLSLIDKKVEVPLNSKKSEGVIIPKKGLFELKKLLEGDEGTLEMAFEGSHLIVRRENTVLMIRLIDGKYPNYQQLIPARLMKRVAVSREDLLSCLRRVSLPSITAGMLGKSMQLTMPNKRMTRRT